MTDLRRCGIHIQWNITQPYKEWDTVICSKMDGPKEYTKWNKSDRKTNIMISHIWNLKNNTNESVYKTNTHRHRKQTYA